jgi:hypothetical protein
MPLSVPQQTVADDTSRFKVLITGRRFGKTTLGIREICKSAAKKPGSINWAVCPSYRMAKQIWWMELKKKLNELRWIETTNEAELTILLKNKSVIALKGCDSPDSLRGVGLDFVIFDEFQDSPKQAWTEVIRPTLSDRNGFALFCGTPKGVGSWSHELYTRAITEQDWGAWQYTTIEGGNVPMEEIESAKRDLPTKIFEQEYLATFTSYQGRVMDFDYKRNVVPLDDPHTGVISVGMDFNYNPFCLVIAQVKGKEIHIFDEMHIPGSNTDEVCDEIKARYPNSRVMVYPDPAARQKRTSAGGKTDFSILINAGFTVKARQSHTPVRDRVNAVNAMLKNAAGETKLFVDPKCKHTIDSLTKLTYKEGTTQIDKNGYEHQADAVGYLVDYLFPVKTQYPEVEGPLTWGVGVRRYN